MNHTSIQRLPYLDSSRGLAALIVLITHFQKTMLPQLNDSPLLKSPLGIIIDGQAAVLFFFILSSYVLTLSVEKNEPFSFTYYFKFMTRRIFRIFPAFIITLFISFFLLQLISTRPDNWLKQYWISSPEISSVFKEALLIFRIPNDPSLRFIPQDWTLSIEIALSFILLPLSFSSRINSLFVLLIVYFSVKFLALDPFVFDFTLGVFLATNLERLKLFWKNTSFKIPIFLLAILFISADYYTPLMKYSDRFLIHHKIWGLAIILWIIVSSGGIQKFLSVAPLKFLGKISYSFYLLHLIILYYVSAAIHSLSVLSFFIVYLFITTLASTMTFYLVEKPFNKLAKALIEK